MTPTALESPTEQISINLSAQRDQGLQMRLFPAQIPEDLDADLDLRVADDLAGMYYIG